MTFTFGLTYMSSGNKALTLVIMTMFLMFAGSIIFIIGGRPDNNQDSGRPVNITDILVDGDELPPTPIPAITAQPTIAQGSIAPIPTPPPIQTPAPIQSPTPQPPRPGALPPNLFPPTKRPLFFKTPAPTPLLPELTFVPTTRAPVSPSPVAQNLPQYPFAVVYECDWNGEKLSLTTKTKSSSVVRLCIEAPPLPANEEPIEVSYLSWFFFERQPYEDQELKHLVQHAVILAKPDPFGLTVMDCNKGAPVCKFATDLRDEFFEADAFLQGKGELVLQFTTNKQVAGVAPVSIYFLLSSKDIKEPLQLGRHAEPVSKTTTTTTTTTTKRPRPHGRGRLKRGTPVFANHQDHNKQQPP